MDKELMLESHGLIVSCQGVAGSPLKDARILAAVASEVISGGASALRLAGPDCIALVRPQTKAPIIGLTKIERAGFGPRITCISSEIVDLASAGADLVAIDATDRKRPEPLVELFATAKALGILIFADIATLDEGMRAAELGADFVATTMSGYTESHQPTVGPDFELLASLIKNLSVPIVLEGRVDHPDHVKQGLGLGAYAVVVGRAITSPRDITKYFLKNTR
jgi:N-acylglucosamine-6-phosphate 2-epimerase